MRRIDLSPRGNWESIVQKQGLTFTKLANGTPYWNESAYYEFTAAEVDALEAATNELHAMCLEAVDKVITKDWFSRLEIPHWVGGLIQEAWEAEPPAIYGRFDFAYDGTQIKLLEYNADTPTSLIEAAVIQWYWKEERFATADQFNSIHERLIAKWKELKNYCSSPLYFAYIPEPATEDQMTVTYLADTAMQAGHDVRLLAMKDIGFHQETGRFMDNKVHPIESIFKLYPWEWLTNEAFSQHLPSTSISTKWIEPIWKMVLSNKGILPILWELYPNHPLLLPAVFESDRTTRFDHGYCTKPLFSREGQNVSLFDGFNRPLEANGGDYGDGGMIKQALATIPNFLGHYPVIGSWVIDGESAGIGIRESSSLITNNTSCFVPHIFR